MGEMKINTQNLFIKIWTRILFNLTIQKQDELRFMCKKFHLALKRTLPVWIEAHADNPTKVNFKSALEIFHKFRKENPYKRFEIRISDGYHYVSSEENDKYQYDESYEPNSIRDEIIGGGIYRGLKYCKGFNLCIRSNNLYALCSNQGVIFVILNDIQEIKERAFKGCSSLKSIILPKGVIYIRDEAFYKCTNLCRIILIYIS